MSYATNSLSSKEELVKNFKLSKLTRIGLFGHFLMVILTKGFWFPVFLYKLINYNNTETFLTNMRIVRKIGVFTCDSFEMKLNRIESINVKRSFADLLFDSGTIVINGTGGNKVILNNLDNPFLVKFIIEVIQNEQFGICL